MEHTLKVRLTATQMHALKKHAEKKKREPEEDLIAVWWGRMCALADYAEKLETKGARFRPYAPRNLDDAQRDKLKAEAVKEGIAPKPPRPKQLAIPGVKR